ncbi:MAG: HDIG domain-containing protein [Candidatus Marinimicrobia bacterium]|nr:HDIG domain-containing protein [Candidatus Neomarinimicrobiota bacterium]
MARREFTNLIEGLPWLKSRRTVRIAIWIGTVLTISWLYPLGEQFEFRYDLNEITREAVIAPFNFPVLKRADFLEDERELARRSVPLLFRREAKIAVDQMAGLVELFSKVRGVQQGETKLEKGRANAFRHRFDDQAEASQQAVTRDSGAVVALKTELVQQFPLDLSSSQWGAIFSGVTEDERTINVGRLERNLQRIIRDVISEGVLELSKRQIGDAAVAVSSGGVEEIIELEFLMDRDEAWAKAITRLQNIYSENQTVERATGGEVLILFILPNLVYDEETTQRRQQGAVDRVPISKGIVRKNERIVDSNTRVTEEVLLKLSSLAAAKTQLLASAGGIQLWLPRIGMIMITTFSLAFFFAWLYVYRRPLYRENRILLLINLLFILILAMGSFFHLRIGLSEYLIPVTVAAMAFTILFDARTAIIGTVTLAILMGFLVGNRIDFVLVNLLAGSISIYSVRQLRRRRQIFTAIFYIVLAYALGITAVEFLKYTTLGAIGSHVMYATINGVLSPIMVYGLIGVLEVIFGLTTNLTLLELSDFNHPLLRRLSREANGTFSHSIIVGNLAEAAAAAIGANSLLCRVGAYYHDIGKLGRPEYFIENQFKQDNPHDRLAPHMSAKVVINHVKNGLELAREYGLPSAVSDFIPMHHGTARIEYFYQRALEKASDENEVKENAYRYTGPKPNTKETGILMLCEAIEAATRSIKKPTLQRIEQMMDRIIEIRMTDSQLNECPLTLREIEMIKGNVREGTGMISVLQGIYHVRIPYPTTGEKAEPESQEEEPTVLEEIPQDKLFDGTPTE